MKIMKKFIFVIIILFTFTQCECASDEKVIAPATRHSEAIVEKPKPIIKKEEPIILMNYRNFNGSRLSYFDKNIKGSGYRIFTLGNGMEEASIFVINLELEKLQIQKLRLELYGSTEKELYKHLNN